LEAWQDLGFGFSEKNESGGGRRVHRLSLVRVRTLHVGLLIGGREWQAGREIDVLLIGGRGFVKLWHKSLVGSDPNGDQVY
jgi:hypothetical protein